MVCPIVGWVLWAQWKKETPRRARAAAICGWIGFVVGFIINILSSNMKTITIGRSSHCDIVIADERVSRVHAEITLVDNKYVYKDVSKNGSNIGGRIILNEKVVIAPGATVLLSNHIPLPWAQIYALLPIRALILMNKKLKSAQIP